MPELSIIRNYATANVTGANLPDIKKLMISIEEYQNIRNTYDFRSKDFQDKSQKYIQLQESVKSIKEKIDLAFASMSSILKKHGKNDSSELYNHVQIKHGSINQLKVEQGTFQKDLDHIREMSLGKKQMCDKLSSDITYLEQAILGIDAIITKDKMVQEKLAMLNVAKSYFKQDGLAKHIRKFYIDKINISMSSYVHLFNFDFLPQIDETAGIVKYWKYSGGQKIAIAILMKIILNFILKNPVKMMILDEPTPYMDTERVEAIRDLVDRIKNVLQVIVITHDVEFMNIDCNKILM